MVTGTQVSAGGNRMALWCSFDGHFGSWTVAGAGSEPWDIDAKELDRGKEAAVASPVLVVWHARPVG
jgi:hypothetical protein